jgi:hypothetical protein
MDGTLSGKRSIPPVAFPLWVLEKLTALDNLLTVKTMGWKRSTTVSTCQAHPTYHWWLLWGWVSRGMV